MSAKAAKRARQKANKKAAAAAEPRQAAAAEAKAVAAAVPTPAARGGGAKSRHVWDRASDHLASYKKIYQNADDKTKELHLPMLVDIVCTEADVAYYCGSFAREYARLPSTDVKWVVLMAAIEYGESPRFLDQILQVDDGWGTWEKPPRSMNDLLSCVFNNTRSSDMVAGWPVPGRRRKLFTLVHNGAEVTAKVRRIIAHVGSPCMHARVGLWPFRCSKNS